MRQTKSRIAQGYRANWYLAGYPSETFDVISLDFFATIQQFDTAIRRGLRLGWVKMVAIRRRILEYSSLDTSILKQCVFGFVGRITLNIGKGNQPMA